VPTRSEFAHPLMDRFWVKREWLGNGEVGWNVTYSHSASFSDDIHAWRVSLSNIAGALVLALRERIALMGRE
jgi:hypothetical protein